MARHELVHMAVHAWLFNSKQMDDNSGGFLALLSSFLKPQLQKLCNQSFPVKLMILLPPFNTPGDGPELQPSPANGSLKQTLPSVLSLSCTSNIYRQHIYGPPK